jgi:hypothetical protein
VSTKSLDYTARPAFAAALLATRRQSGRAIPIKDSLIAARALVHGLTVATRRVRLILRGYALDAIDLRSSSPDTSLQHESSGSKETHAEHFVRQVMDASRTQFASPGLGDTWRLFAPDLAGGGLTLGGTLVHLSAFRVVESPSKPFDSRPRRSRR